MYVMFVVLFGGVVGLATLQSIPGWIVDIAIRSSGKKTENRQ